MLDKPDATFSENVFFQLAAEKIIHRIATNGRGDQDHDQDHDVEYVLTGQKSGCEQQRVARQKESDQEARFAEHDAAQDGVTDPRRPPKINNPAQVIGARQTDEPFDLRDDPLKYTQYRLTWPPPPGLTLTRSAMAYPWFRVSVNPEIGRAHV